MFIIVNRFFTIVATALATGAFVFMYNSDTTIASIAGGVAAVVSTFIFFLEHMLKSNGSKYINAFVYFFTPNGKCSYMDKNIVYSRLDDTHWQQEKKYTIKSHCHSLQSFEERFCWSADSNSAIIRPTEPGQRICQIKEIERWTVFTVQFERSVLRGKTINSGSKIENLVAAPSAVKPFLTSTIFTKTSSLSMTVRIPAQYKPQNAKFTACPISSHTPAYQQDLAYNETDQSFSVKIDYPRKKWRYAITWEYGN